MHALALIGVWRQSDYYRLKSDVRRSCEPSRLENASVLHVTVSPYVAGMHVKRDAL